MNKLTLAILCLSVMSCLHVNAQDEFPWPNLGTPKIIEPGSPGSINEIIHGDTTFSGERLHNHYILRRDMTYLYTHRINNVGYPLMITAEDGEGELPIIKALGPYHGNDEAERAFHAQGDLYLKDITINGFDTGGNFTDNATLRLAADSITVVCNNVNFDFNRQNSHRVNAVGCSLFVENCIISNQGVAERLGQGFALNMRGNYFPIIHFRNNTIYNMHNGISIKGGHQAKYNKLIFENNTIVNTGTGGSEYGKPDTLIVKNNLFVNIGILGDGNFGYRYYYDDDQYYYFSIDTNYTDTTFSEIIPPKHIEFENNHFYLDPEIASLLPDSVDKAGDFLFAPYLWDVIEDQNSNVIKNEAFTFDNFPATINEYKGYIEDFYKFVYSGASQMPQFDADFRTLDFGYSNNHPAYHGSTDNGPIGDRNWFPDFTAPAVESPVVYCRGAVAEPLVAFGDSLKFYTSMDDVYSDTAIVPTTDLVDTTTYYVTSTKNGIESEYAKIDVMVYDYVIQVEKQTIQCGQKSRLYVNTNYIGPGTENFTWINTGDTIITDTLNYTVRSKDSIIVVATTTEGCSAETTFPLEITPSNVSADLHYITTDTITGELIVSWSTKDTVLINSVLFYAWNNEWSDYSLAGYHNLGTDFSPAPIHLDSTIQKSAFFIATKDHCGFENMHLDSTLLTPVPVSHKPVYLTENYADSTAVALQWTPYQGLPVFAYEIQKRSDTTTFESIKILPANDSVYIIKQDTDTTYYRIKTTLISGINDLIVSYSNQIKLLPDTSSTVGNELNTRLTQGNLIHIFPNPARNYMYVKTSLPYVKNDYIIRMIPTQGNVVFQVTMDQPKVRIPVEYYPKGLYFIQILNQQYEIIESQKILLE